MNFQEIFGLIIGIIGLIGLIILWVYAINVDEKRRQEDIKLKKELILKLNDIDTRLFHIALCSYVKKERKEINSGTRSKTK